MRVYVLLGHRLEADDFGDVPPALHVRGSGAMTRLAAVSVVQSSLEVGSLLELLLIKVFVTGFTNIAPNIFRQFILWWRDVLFLSGGN
jgi:hypothetical protein